jgi:mycobactin lysine-N-oxygenase
MATGGTLLMSDIERLLVIGAGPKAAAIAAKSKVLRTHGCSAPEIWVLEENALCANWTGKYGFTNGLQSLGTPPEKDIGFPYAIDLENEAVTKELFSRYSWSSYLNFELRRFGEWIDRGRPSPIHEDWARYIGSVIKESADKVLFGSLTELRIEGDEWVACYSKDSQSMHERFSGVVITGPGRRKMPSFKIPNSEFIKFGDTFWRNTDIIRELDDQDGCLPVVVVGGGETAGAIVGYLIDETGDRRIPITVITRSGAIFSRGEGFYENRRFTNSDDWQLLPGRVRREVIDRADRGVFSVKAIGLLSNARDVSHRYLEVDNVSIRKNLKRSMIISATTGEKIECQLAVFAFGFDPFWFIQLLPDAIRKKLSDPEDVENHVEHDLSLSRDLVPLPLFVPMISGFQQGPGFPNLSCLGNLSDRILGRDTIPGC